MSIIDICGDLLDGQVVNRQDGYIETPNYPDLYPPEVSCTCNLTARNAEIGAQHLNTAKHPIDILEN